MSKHGRKVSSGKRMIRHIFQIRNLERSRENISPRLAKKKADGKLFLTDTYVLLCSETETIPRVK